jgi:hypothetical protein
MPMKFAKTSASSVRGLLFTWWTTRSEMINVRAITPMLMARPAK